MMKRLWLPLVAVGMLTACQAPSSDAEATAAREPSAWLRPPSVTAVSRDAGTAIVSGLADPGARVVLRGEGGAAFAAAADREGRFVVRVAGAGTDLILTPEVQNGQEAAASPDRLVLLAAGPAALLRPGGPTRRLDGSPGGLDVIDTDGRALVASGRASAGQEVAIVAGRQTVRAIADADGRWSVVLPQLADGIMIGQTVYDLPVWATDGISSDGKGWLIGWRTPDNVIQRSWLPSRAS